MLPYAWSKAVNIETLTLSATTMLYLLKNTNWHSAHRLKDEKNFEQRLSWILRLDHRNGNSQHPLCAWKESSGVDPIEEKFIAETLCFIIFALYEQIYIAWHEE